jgi:NTP pyrophosphatase (non-canonical NTP hydrolase)
MVKQVQAECLVVTSEECAELTKECMKILRFGLDDEKQKNLISELGDVQCMIKLTCNHFNLDVDKISEASDNKYNKLRKWSNLING